MSVEAPTFDPATDPAAQAVAGIPHQAGAPAAETDQHMSYEDAMARSAAYLESLGFDPTPAATREEANYDREQLEREHQQASRERREAKKDRDLHTKGQEQYLSRIGTEDEALYGDPVTQQAVREEHIGRDAEERFRAENLSLARRDEFDPFDKVVGVAFENAAKQAGRRAVDAHREEIDAEVKRHRAEKAAEAERQRIEDESYKARQERDQLFFDGERADDWDKKVQALDSAFEYALAHEDDPRAMEDYNTYWGRLRAGERKAYDAYREKIENPTPEEPAPGQPQPGRRRTAERAQDSGQMTDAELRAAYQRKPRLSEVREARRWRNRVPQMARQASEVAGRVISRKNARKIGEVAGRLLSKWNSAELPAEEFDDGEFITGPNADPAAAAHYRIDGKGDYVAPERRRGMSPKNWAKHVISLLEEPQRPGESDKAYGKRISDRYKEDRSGWRARSRDVRPEFSANEIVTRFTNDLLAAERQDRQHAGQAQHRVWTRENLLGGLAEQFHLAPTEAQIAAQRLVERGVLQPVPGQEGQYQHEGGSISEVGGTF